MVFTPLYLQDIPEVLKASIPNLIMMNIKIYQHNFENKYP